MRPLDSRSFIIGVKVLASELMFQFRTKLAAVNSVICSWQVNWLQSTYWSVFNSIFSHRGVNNSPLGQVTFVDNLKKFWRFASDCMDFLTRYRVGRVLVKTFSVLYSSHTVRERRILGGDRTKHVNAFFYCYHVWPFFVRHILSSRASYSLRKKTCEFK